MYYCIMEILELLKNRFDQHPNRHIDVSWNDIVFKINKPEILNSIKYMEETGGEPDVIYDKQKNLLLICDCSKESPKERRSLCYDKEARLGRKKNAPISSALEEATKHDVFLMDLEIYTLLQTIEEFDLTSSSWIKTPDSIREKGGAIFCEKRYGHVFYFHNGADSYYSNRGWRGYITL